MVRDIKTSLMIPLFFLVACYMQPCLYGESEIPCLFIFGDSLSDSGNNNHLLTVAKSNYEPYGIDFPIGHTGRFTNGKTSIDIIGQLLGFEEFIPPYANTIGSDILKGVNYASGGAGIRIETSRHLGLVISLGSQLTHHRDIVSQIASRLGSPEKAQQYLHKCLYYVNIGRNDYIKNYFLPFYPTSHIYSPEKYAEALIEELSLNLLALHDIGARKYVLVGLERIGCTPIAINSHLTNGSCVEEENVAAFIFNDKLKSLVDNFNNNFSADSKFIFINSTSQALENSNGTEPKFLDRRGQGPRPMEEVTWFRPCMHVPWISGFSVSNAACCPSGLFGECIPHQMPCYSRSEYVFWDGWHFTEAWNLLIAISSYNASNPSFTYPMDIKHLVDHIMF